MNDAERTVEAILADTALRARLVAALKPAVDAPDWWTDRARPFLAGLSSAAVVMLAFLVPSLQDQWDRVQTRRAVDRYAEIGRQLMHQDQYTAAEAAFDRALELAGAQRQDLIELRMQAHVQRMDEDPEWPGQVPDALNESDFLYVLASDAGVGRARERAAALAAYGAFLAGRHRWVEAERRLREAIVADPRAPDPHVRLGNLQGDRGRWPEAEAEYRAALALDAANANALYNLGLLYGETDRTALAEARFRDYVRLRPEEPLGLQRLAEILALEGKADEAREFEHRARRAGPSPEPVAPPPGDAAA